MQTNEKELAALADLIDRFGGDRSRWPAEERRRFAPFIASDPEARRLLAEAAALDRLLDAAPRLDAGRQEALARRIVAAAAAAPRNVTPLPAAAKRPASARRPMWQAAALLAASLVMGLLVGTTELLDGVLGPETQVALDEDMTVEEDLL